MATAKKKTVRRNFDIDVTLYNKLLEDADKNARTFPKHAVRIWEDYLLDQEKMYAMAAGKYDFDKHEIIK